ncbi:unnamed protein product, partial [Amoebophrya sp. A25]
IVWGLYLELVSKLADEECRNVTLFLRRFKGELRRLIEEDTLGLSHEQLLEAERGPVVVVGASPMALLERTRWGASRSRSLSHKKKPNGPSGGMMLFYHDRNERTRKKREKEQAEKWCSKIIEQRDAEKLEGQHDDVSQLAEEDVKGKDEPVGTQSERDTASQGEETLVRQNASSPAFSEASQEGQEISPKILPGLEGSHTAAPNPLGKPEKASSGLLGATSSSSFRSPATLGSGRARRNPGGTASLSAMRHPQLRAQRKRLGEARTAFSGPSESQSWAEHSQKAVDLIMRRVTYRTWKVVVDNFAPLFDPFEAGKSSSVGGFGGSAFGGGQQLNEWLLQKGVPPDLGHERSPSSRDSEFLPRLVWNDVIGQEGEDAKGRIGGTKKTSTSTKSTLNGASG